jgi:hypothetical protein
MTQIERFFARSALIYCHKGFAAILNIATDMSAVAENPL